MVRINAVKDAQAALMKIQAEALDRKLLKEYVTQAETTVTKEDLSLKLTDGQRPIYNEILVWADMQVFSKYLIQGYAGTGKTFLLSLLTVAFIKSAKKVALVAPTRKAVKILYQKVKEYVDSDKLEFSTLHSLLRFKEVINPDNGEITFEPETGFTSSPTVPNFDVIICDEASMVDRRLYRTLVDQCFMAKVKLIFSGDMAQLPPVTRDKELQGDNISCVFQPYWQQVDNLKVVSLTDIVRQALTNPIIQLSIAVREKRANQYNIPIMIQGMWNFETKEGVRKIDENCPVSELIPLLFGSTFDANTDFSKVLAYTNATVTYWNDLIRTYKYQELSYQKFLVGEKLIADEPILDSTKGEKPTILFSTNQELVVESVNVVEITIQQVSVKVYELEVVGESNATTRELTEEEQEEGMQEDLKVKIHVVHEDFKDFVDSVMNALAIEARRVRADHMNPDARKEAGSIWKQRKDFGSTFAKVKYNYALTIHKSQGSTFENVIFILDDVNMCRNEQDKYALMYVAITRASKRLFIY